MPGIGIDCVVLGRRLGPVRQLVDETARPQFLDAHIFGKTDETQLFEGKGVDDVFFAFHKAQQFVGFELLPSFSWHDVMKNPDMGADMERYAKHLDAVM